MLCAPSRKVCKQDFNSLTVIFQTERQPIAAVVFFSEVIEGEQRVVTALDHRCVLADVLAGSVDPLLGSRNPHGNLRRLKEAEVLCLSRREQQKQNGCPREGFY